MNRRDEKEKRRKKKKGRNVTFLFGCFEIHGKQKRRRRNTCKRVQRRVAHCRSSAYDSCEHERSRRCVSSYPRARRCVRHAQCVARTTRIYVPREPRFMPLAANHAARLSAVPRAQITATNQVIAPCTVIRRAPKHHLLTGVSLKRFFVLW